MLFDVFVKYTPFKCDRSPPRPLFGLAFRRAVPLTCWPVLLIPPIRRNKMLSTVVDKLIPLRRSLIFLVSLTSFALLIASCSLLGYQTTKTQGYQRCLPAIIVIALLGCSCPVYFLYCPPIRFIKNNEKLAKAARSLALELAVYGGIGAYLLVVTADLHAE